MHWHLGEGVDECKGYLFGRVPIHISASEGGIFLDGRPELQRNTVWVMKPN